MIFFKEHDVKSLDGTTLGHNLLYTPPTLSEMNIREREELEDLFCMFGFLGEIVFKFLVVLYLQK